MELETAEFIMALEEEFQIELHDRATEGLHSIREFWIAVVAELDRLGRPRDANAILKRITAIAAYFGHVDRGAIRLDTPLVDELRRT